MSVLSTVSTPRFCFLTVPAQSPLNCVALELEVASSKNQSLLLAISPFLHVYLDICRSSLRFCASFPHAAQATSINLNAEDQIEMVKEIIRPVLNHRS